MDISSYIYSACYDDVYLEVGMVNTLKFSSPWLNERDVALWEESSYSKSVSAITNGFAVCLLMSMG